MHDLPAQWPQAKCFAIEKKQQIVTAIITTNSALNPETPRQRRSSSSSYGPEVPVGVRVVTDVLVRDVPPLQQVLVSLILQEKHTSCSGVHTHTHTAFTV